MLLADVIHWFNNQNWFGFGANILQWLTAVPAIVVAILAWRLRRCRVLWCLRLGQHPVDETTWKVCPRHHLPQHHHSLRARHKEKHPERLGHGES